MLIQYQLGKNRIKTELTKGLLKRVHPSSDRHHKGTFIVKIRGGSARRFKVKAKNTKGSRKFKILEKSFLP